MLMVIFGAGASYDSWPSFPPDRLPRDAEFLRPPLAKELFLYAPQFRAVSAKYPRCQPIIPYLESQENVEDILEQFGTEAVQNPERRSQLTAIQFYIREIVRLCEAHWRLRTNGVTNYRTLLDQLAEFPDVCFVTFNSITNSLLCQSRPSLSRALCVPLNTSGRSANASTVSIRSQ
jgi:hypothetical protein